MVGKGFPAPSQQSLRGQGEAGDWRGWKGWFSGPEGLQVSALEAAGHASIEPSRAAQEAAVGVAKAVGGGHCSGRAGTPRPAGARRALGKTRPRGAGGKEELPTMTGKHSNSDNDTSLFMEQLLSVRGQMHTDRLTDSVLTTACEPGPITVPVLQMKRPRLQERATATQSAK